MTNKTDYIENCLLKAFFKNDPAARATLANAEIEMALVNGTPDETTSDISTLSELSGNGYARIPESTMITKFADPFAGVMLNSLGDLAWPQVGAGGWNPVNGVCWVDTYPATERVWWYVVVSPPITPLEGNVVLYSQDQLSIEEK